MKSSTIIHDMNEYGVRSVDYNDKPDNKINLNVDNDTPQIFRTLRNIDLNLGFVE